jgi:intermediate cleaving peptidase 55
LYLTGFNEPDAALVLEKAESVGRWTMYVTPKNEHFEMWDGIRTGLDQAVSHFGVDDAKPIESLPSFIKSLGSSTMLFTDLSLSSTENSSTSVLESTGINFSQTHATNQPSEKFNLSKILQPFHSSEGYGYFSKKRRPIGPVLHQMRVIKSQDEVRVMRKSGQISGRAFAKAMSLTKPGMSEHHLQAILNYELMVRGSSHFAYVPVIAGGRNALTLHYIRNDQILKDNDLVLVDCGGVIISF